MFHSIFGPGTLNQIIYIMDHSSLMEKVKITRSAERFIAFSGLKIQPDLRNQTNQIPLQKDLRAGSTRKDQEQILAPTQGTHQEAPRSIETEIDPTALMIVRTSSQESLMRNLCQFHQTVIRLQESLGLVNIVLMSTILVSR